MKKEKKIALEGKKMNELKKLLLDAKTELFTLGLDKAQRKLKNTSSFFHKRKEIAQILTKMKEMEAKQ